MAHGIFNGGWFSGTNDDIHNWTHPWANASERVSKTRATDE